MKNETVQRINNLGKAGYIICKIGKICVMIAAIACLVGGIFFCCIPQKAGKIELTTANSARIQLDGDFDLLGLLEIDDAEGILSLGQNTYQLILQDGEEPSTVTRTIYLSQLKWVMFATVLTCVAAFFVSLFAEKLCAYFKNCDTPFSEKSAKGLLRLAWSILPLSLVGTFPQSVANAVFTGSFDAVLGVDLVTVVLVLCIFMLSFIFKYGAALQAESDETL